MILFLVLQAINMLHRDRLIEACVRIIDSGWYIQGEMNIKYLKKSLPSIVVQDTNGKNKKRRLRCNCH